MFVVFEKVNGSDRRKTGVNPWTVTDIAPYLGEGAPKPPEQWTTINMVWDGSSVNGVNRANTIIVTAPFEETVERLSEAMGRTPTTPSMRG